MLDHGNPVSLHKVLGNGDVLTRCLGGARTQCEILDFTGPTDIGGTFQSLVPPLLIYIIIVVCGDDLSEEFLRVSLKKDFIKFVALSELGVLGFFQ